MPAIKTPYEILEVNENATDNEIKKAYRKLSLIYHPDKPTGNTEKFQEISEAYEILTDPNKKNEHFMKQNNDGIDEFLSNIFGNMMMGHGHGGGHGHNQPFINMFNGIPIHMMNMSKPTPIVHNIEITIQQVLMGTTVPLEIERWIIENNIKIHEKETIYIRIPAGIDENEIIIEREKGNVLSDIKGDIKIFIKVSNNTLFLRKGLDLILHKTLSLKEALCGFESFNFTYIDGQSFTLKNTLNTIILNEQQKIIPGLGLQREGHNRGNLIIVFIVEFPTSLTAEQVNVLKTIL
jgi:DnaJ-class molecular chaperone